MILLLACLSLLIGPGELGVLNNGHTASVTAILGIGVLPFPTLAAGPRYCIIHSIFAPFFYIYRFNYIPRDTSIPVIRFLSSIRFRGNARFKIRRDLSDINLALTLYEF